MPALEWHADISSGAVASDNWLLSGDEISSLGIEAGFSGSARLVAPTSAIVLEGGASRTDFESDELTDAEEYGVSLQLAREHRFGKSSVTIGYRSRDTVLG